MGPDRNRNAAIRAVASILAFATLAVVTPVSSAEATTFDLELYATLLRDHTVDSDDTAGTRVDYARIRRSASWRKLVAQLRRSRPDQLGTREERLAFWINAYNILAIQTVAEHYPLESIRDVGSFLSPVWDRDAGRIGGKSVTLGQIEHEILRKLDEPRIHVAIVCASTSCPSLAREPFEASRLDAQLDATTRRFVADPRKGLRIDRAQSRVTLSKIFDWFEDDFASAGGVLAWVRPYLPQADADWIATTGDEIDVEHFDYDWTVNDSSGAAAPGP